MSHVPCAGRICAHHSAQGQQQRWTKRVCSWLFRYKNIKIIQSPFTFKFSFKLCCVHTVCTSSVHQNARRSVTFLNWASCLHPDVCDATSSFRRIMFLMVWRRIQWRQWAHRQASWQLAARAVIAARISRHACSESISTRSAQADDERIKIDNRYEIEIYICVCFSWMIVASRFSCKGVKASLCRAEAQRTAWTYLHICIFPWSPTFGIDYFLDVPQDTAWVPPAKGPWLIFLEDALRCLGWLVKEGESVKYVQSIWSETFGFELNPMTIWSCRYSLVYQLREVPCNSFVPCSYQQLHYALKQVSMHESSFIVDAALRIRLDAIVLLPRNKPCSFVFGWSFCQALAILCFAAWYWQP